MRQALKLTALFVVLFSSAPPVHAELPDADTVLADIGYSAEQIADVKAGKIATGTVKGAHERDLAVAFAFAVPVAPAELVKDLKAGLLADVDPTTITRTPISGAGTVQDFAALTLNPDADGRAKRYASAKPGDDLNLSAEEIAAFNKLGSSAATSAVEDELRRMLLARYQAYRAQGLDGIAPYARSGGSRSVSGDLRAALESGKSLQKYAPAAYTAMMEYPRSEPAGTEDTFSVSHFKAHDVPTIVLAHAMYVSDGDAIIVLQRQFYVSEGFNCEQAVAGFLPVKDGTVVIYSNHTSTDQVAGFGGGTKRSIGGKLMSSELQKLFTKVQQRAR